MLVLDGVSSQLSGSGVRDRALMPILDVKFLY